MTTINTLTSDEVLEFLSKVESGEISLYEDGKSSNYLHTYYGHEWGVKAFIVNGEWGGIASLQSPDGRYYSCTTHPDKYIACVHWWGPNTPSSVSSFQGVSGGLASANQLKTLKGKLVGDESLDPYDVLIDIKMEAK